MTTTWILIANSSEAHLYSSPKAKLFDNHFDLEQVCDFNHPASRQKEADLIADRFGRRASSPGSNTYNGYSPKEHEADNFAKELADKLWSEQQQNKFQDLIIAAPPQFHGLLNKYFKGNHLENVVSLDIEKDYTKFRSEQLMSQLQHYL